MGECNRQRVTVVSTTQCDEIPVHIGRFMDGAPTALTSRLVVGAAELIPPRSLLRGEIRMTKVNTKQPVEQERAASRPEHVAWWCADCHQISQWNPPPIEHGWPTPLGHHKCDGKFTPLYPPSVVAGELRDLRAWIERNDPCSASDVYKEAARRAAVWEAK